jgi:dipeptidyl aminopeptidase/acylaminoacyl peptidase
VVVDGREGIPAAVRDRLTTPTSHRVPTPDGEQVPCFVYAGSADGDPAVAGASVVHVHGGPEAAAQRIFSPVLQALSLLGFAVLVPNVRGSTGYGKRWYSLDDVEKRLDSVADLAALHAWLPTCGLDPARSALWGGSYGGYMVLAGVSMQPDRWAAGVDIVGMSSLVTFLENTSGYRRAFREREYGSLEHHHDVLVAASPITYLGDIVAPLFVIHGANDPRVPLSEAQQIAAALGSRGIACELRVYDDEGHGLAKRVNRLDAYPAAMEFLLRALAAG